MQIKRIALGGIIMTVIMFSGCSTTVQNLAIGEEKTLETGKTEQESVTEKDINMNEKESFNAESNINDVIHDSAFDDYGRLIFPVDMEIEDNLKLKDVSSILPWYSEVNTDKTVEIVNYMKNQAMNGEQIFYPIYSEEEMQADAETENTEVNKSGDELENVTPGSEEYRGFILDNVLHSQDEGDIHYNVYIPDAYDGIKEYALYVTLPGYQGLYFQGVGENIRTEDFGFEAQKYITDMIIVAPQLNDWGQTSADQTIELTQYFLTHYIINTSKVYINGYSGGGETLSLVLAKQPELYTAALMCSSQWDGAYEPVVEMKTPVYFVIGESDEYYGSEPFKEAYQQIHELYKEQGLPESEIDKLVVLDVKDKDYFEGTPVTYQHGGGYLFCRDKEIMGWLFNQ